MKYSFEEQESRYQRLRQLGKAVDCAGKSFEDFDLRVFLEQTLSSLSWAVPRPRALEYGTGTGPGACFLAARGFEVDAIDICPTAIELARRFAAQRCLAVRYEIQDICEFRCEPESFDLVVDNYCLHRLIHDRERCQAFHIVRSALKPNGYYILGSTVYISGQTFGDDDYHEPTGIIYRRLSEQSATYEDAVQWKDGWFVARQRRLRASVLKAELENAGFRVLRQEGGLLLCRPNPATS